MTPAAQLYDERFQVISLAGTGGMGAVFRALDTRTGQVVALKVLLSSMKPDAETRFEREARALSELNHPAVVRYVGRGRTSQGQPYLAMEWVEGETLCSKLRSGPLSVAETIALGARIADALSAAHAQHIVHRDVKPANIILEGGALDRAKLVDFGIATLPGAARATDSGTIVGTPSYMAPEQARGAPVIEPCADIFSLGCVLYECITGEPAFEGPQVVAVLARIVFEPLPLLRERGHNVPRALDELLSRMMAKSPADRVTRAADVARSLSAISALSESSVERLAAPAALTSAEQRILSIVLLRSAALIVPADDPEGTTVEAPQGGPLQRAIVAIEANGGQLAFLADGTLAIQNRGAGLATDLAALAAQSAIALHGILPDSTIAVATGRKQDDGGRAIGEAIERAARMLYVRGRVSGLSAVDIDDVTAGLLDLRFEVIAGPFGQELVGEREIAERARTLLGRPTPFVGRKREMTALLTLFSECVDEPAACAALITAPAGVGKSRLRLEITASIAARSSAEIWIARGDPLRAGVSFGLLAQLIRHTVRLSIGEPLEAARQKLLARVSRFVSSGEQLRVAEMLGELVGAPFPDEGRVQLRAARQDPRLLGDQIREAFHDLVQAEVLAKPLVVILEDLHWGDTPSVDVLNMVLGRLSERPFLVIAFARPEVRERFPSLFRDRGLLELHLTELSRRESERLCQDVLSDAATPQLLSSLWERSSGNAFFLEELLRSTSEGNATDLPTTMRAMLESRIMALGSEDRKLLRAASIFGDVFFRGGLVSLLGSDGHDDERLERLTRDEWIVRRAGTRLRNEVEYTFGHALIRDAVYSMLTDSDRSLGHRLAGEWLEALGESDAAVLAEHFERGGQLTRAVHFRCSAAEMALEANNLQEVIAHAARASELGATGIDLGRVALARALAHNWRGEHTDAEVWADTAIQSLPQRDMRWVAAIGERVWTAGNSGDGEKVSALADLILAADVQSTSIGAFAQALSHAIAWSLVLGRHQDADRIHAGLERLHAVASDNPTVIGASLSARIFAASIRGDASASRALLSTAIGHYEMLGDLRSMSRELSGLAFMCSRLGAFHEAEAAARRAVQLALRLGLDFVMSNAQLNLGAMLFHARQLIAAKEALALAAAMSAQHQNAHCEGAARAYLALTLRRMGDMHDAEAEARRAIAVIAAFKPLVPLAVAALADVLLAQGRAVEGLEEGRRAYDLLRELHPVEEGEAFVHLTYLKALLANGEGDAAKTAAEAARAHILAEAQRIGDLGWRRSFCENVPDNAEILALTRELVGSEPEYAASGPLPG